MKKLRLKFDEVAVPAQGFFENYVLGTIGLDKEIGYRLFALNVSARANGLNNIIIKKRDQELIIKNREENEHRNFLINKTAELNNLGMAYEKEGRIEDAITIYEQNIQLGYRASHSFDRLRILYRKRGDKANMLRVISRKYEVYDLSKEELETELRKYT